jgi:multiple sugar transport system ATP-binding protein
MYPGITVRENLAFPLEQRKISREEIQSRVKETAEILRIDHLLDKVATKLTSGEKQRVAIGRAIIRRPQVYLMDEPLTNLDAGLRAVMRVELSRLQRELKQTMIYVTHDQLEGMSMANKIAVMNEGQILQYDTPETIFNRPSNLFVAGFVGSPTMNFVECTVSKTNGRTTLDFGSFKINVPQSIEEYLSQTNASKELVLGVRPQDIQLSLDNGVPDSIEAKVDVTELVGDRIIIDVSIASTSMQVEADRRLPVSVNQRVWLTLDKQKFHLFDRKTAALVV